MSLTEIVLASAIGITVLSLAMLVIFVAYDFVAGRMETAVTNYYGSLTGRVFGVALPAGLAIGLFVLTR